MSDAYRHLVFHAAVVLLFGLLLGAPYARAIKRGASVQVVNSWRVAQTSLPLGATLMLATAAVLGSLQVPEAVLWMVVWPMVVSAYAFCVATPLAALTGDRGLQRSQGWGQVVHASNMLGAAGSMLSAVVFLGAAAVSL